MTSQSTPSPDAARLERTYDTPAELLWELMTTPAGLEEWWAPDGFETRVSELELRPGGQVRYTMTATHQPTRKVITHTQLTHKTRAAATGPAHGLTEMLLVRRAGFPAPCSRPFASLTRFARGHRGNRSGRHG